MKTLWSLVIVVAVSILFFGGLNLVTLNIASNNDLSSDSDQLILNTNPSLQAYYNKAYNNLSSDNINPDEEGDLNGIEDFFKEYTAYKNKYDQVKGALKSVYTAPDWMLYIIPFLDADDLEVYIHVYRALVWVLLIVIFIKALRSGGVD